MKAIVFYDGHGVIHSVVQLSPDSRAKPHHEQYDTLEVNLDEDNPQALYDTHAKYHVDPVSRKLILRPEPRAKKQKRSQKSSGA